MTDAATTQPTVDGAIDVNVHLSRYPFRRLPLDEPAALAKKLRALGIRQAWAGSFDALLHRDVGALNAALAETCRTAGDGLFVPFGTVNPSLPDWEDDLVRCNETFRMPGVRLHPNYHGYKLDDRVFSQVLEFAAGAGLIVQVVVSMEDERMQHPLVRVPPVDLAPLAGVLAQVPRARVILLNALRQPRGAATTSIAKIERASFDIGVLESVGGVAALLEQIPAERVLFGSHAPFHYPESAVLKFRESPPLPGDAAERILRKNAESLRGGR